jgi:MoaA/NifB/PqqE/SkfB family radical SAM enzyme
MDIPDRVCDPEYFWILMNVPYLILTLATKCNLCCRYYYNRAKKAPADMPQPVLNQGRWMYRAIWETSRDAIPAKAITGNPPEWRKR